MSTYDELMAQGGAALNSGKTELALEKFSEAYLAAHYSVDGESMARASQMCGVALRLLGRYDEAHDKFQDAIHLLEFSHNIVLSGSILRDWAMNDYDRGWTCEAIARIGEAVNLHGLSGDSNELGASIGFRARITGWMSDYMEADELLRKGGNQVYLLNNFIWWLRNERYLTRWKMLPTALQLAKATGMRQRGIEALIITVLGDHIYTAIKLLRRHGK